VKLKASALVAYAKKAAAEGWGYVLGGQGEMYSKELAQKWAKSRNKPSSWIGTKVSYFVTACARWFGHRVADCSGLIIKAIQSVNPDYKDRNADTLFAQADEKGKVGTIPEKPGVCVWRKGHTGVYEGNGSVVEAGGYKKGVVHSKLNKPATGKKWTHWYIPDGVDYSEYDKPKPAPKPEDPKPVESHIYGGSSYVNLRATAGGKKIGKVKKGDTVVKLSSTEYKGNTWWKVKRVTDGTIGWCIGEYFK
jgi:hypothetical protein